MWGRRKHRPSALARVGTIGEAVITPLQKPGKAKGPSSIRPLTLSNSFRKILSLITLRRIQQQVDNYTDPWQAAFKRGRSCGDLVWCQRVLLAVVMERHWSFHKDVVIEPPLLPLTGEKLPPGSNLSDGARLDVSCINLWSPLSRALMVPFITSIYQKDHQCQMASDIRQSQMTSYTRYVILNAYQNE